MTMAPNTTKRLRPAEDTAAIRCYNQGLGDCFLLAFPRDGNPDEPFYVVIDCGIARGTPDEEMRMQQVVADIHAATDGHLDVLALTHQHYDHVSGFAHARDLWQQITVDHLFLPWTENPNDPDAATIGKAALRLSQAASQAAERLAWLDRGSNWPGLHLTEGLLAAGSESFDARSAQGTTQGWTIALDCCKNTKPVYCEPGDVLPLHGTGIKAYVLGPPRLRNKDGNEVVSESGKHLVYLLEDRKEMYSYEQFGLASDGAGMPHADDTKDVALYANADIGDTLGIASALGVSETGENDVFDRYCPFDSSFRIEWDNALSRAFFRDHYTSHQQWRRVDDDWLGAASDMALRAGAFTNNLSLVLAFELPRSRKILLFVGDAQVGNWLSWHQIGHWWPQGVEGAVQPSGSADMDNLLGRVAFYKVGHHGSHNATIRDRGLAKMPEGLIAFIPVSVPVAHDVMGYCPMPFYPLLRALRQKARGAVFLANGNQLTSSLEEAHRHQVNATVRVSNDMLGAKIFHPGTNAEQRLEEEVPLWIEFTLDDRVPS